MDNEGKLKYIRRVMDLNGETEDKKHGYYKVLNCKFYKLKWDSWNGDYYLWVNGAMVDVQEYIDILFNEVRRVWNLPSNRDNNRIDDLIDYLYVNDNNIKYFYDRGSSCKK